MHNDGIDAATRLREFEEYTQWWLDAITYYTEALLQCKDVATLEALCKLLYTTNQQCYELLQQYEDTIAS